MINVTLLLNPDEKVYIEVHIYSMFMDYEYLIYMLKYISTHLCKALARCCILSSYGPNAYEIEWDTSQG